MSISSSGSGSAGGGSTGIYFPPGTTLTTTGTSNAIPWVTIGSGGCAGTSTVTVPWPSAINPYESPKTLEMVVDFIFAAVEAHLRRIIKEELEKKDDR